MPDNSYSPKKHILSLVLGLCLVSVNAQNSICKEAWMIVKTAEKFHYQPRQVDDDFSELVFDGFMNLLDPYGLYLSSSDCKELEQAKYTIDDEILNQGCTFLKKATDIFSSRLLRIDSLLTTFETRDFDYNTDDSISILNGNVQYSESQFTKQWERLIKLQVLSAYFSGSDPAGESKDEVAERLQDLGKVAINRSHCRIKSKISFQGGLEAYVGSIFLKAVSMAFDLHTMYFTQAEEKAFNGALAKETKSFGFYVSRNDFGEIEIVHIVPGSPAWKSNAMNAGDVILKVTASATEKDFECIDLKEAMDFMASEETERAVFLVRKKNGEEFELSLQKEKTEVRENVIQGFILEGKAKTGYIYLPSFYSQSDVNNFNFEGCANDVTKELIRLKREGISGLILDLRDNGGGSMMEAILLSGLFIDYGALSISQSRDEEPVTVKDMNRGTIYDGPLLVLVNHFSASASELFAAAMQDYNRAVIVGTKSFGKSSMQTILPVDAYRYKNPETYRGVPHGYLKVTQGVFYRVSGKSLQNEGVTPDIVLPSAYPGEPIGERSYPSALAPADTDKKTYYYPLKPLPVQTLKDLSQARLMHDSSFIFPGEMHSKGNPMHGDDPVPLEFEAFKRYYQAMQTPDVHNEEGSFSVKYPGYIENINLQFESFKNENEGMISRIESDVYIGEAYAIMDDLIHLSNNKAE